MEFAWYCVISPEGCASILWRDAAYAPQAATALKPTADDLDSLGIVDEIIKEPLGGAHRNPNSAVESLKTSLMSQLNNLNALPIETLLEQRYQKYRHVGMEEAK